MKQIHKLVYGFVSDYVYVGIVLFFFNCQVVRCGCCLLHFWYFKLCIYYLFVRVKNGQRSISDRLRYVLLDPSQVVLFVCGCSRGSRLGGGAALTAHFHTICVGYELFFFFVYLTYNEYKRCKSTFQYIYICMYVPSSSSSGLSRSGVNA